MELTLFKLHSSISSLGGEIVHVLTMFCIYYFFCKDLLPKPVSVGHIIPGSQNSFMTSSRSYSICVDIKRQKRLSSCWLFF
jgi:hypothetical protein